MSGPVCVCDYQFSDEGQSEMIERLKEMLDIDAAEEDLDTRQETPSEIIKENVAAGREECSCTVSSMLFMDVVYKIHKHNFAQWQSNI